jgi:hypothetical protein
MVDEIRAALLVKRQSPPGFRQKTEIDRAADEPGSGISAAMRQHLASRRHDAGIAVARHLLPGGGLDSRLVGDAGVNPILACVRTELRDKEPGVIATWTDHGHESEGSTERAQRTP